MLDLPEISAHSVHAVTRVKPEPGCALVTTVGPRVFNRLASGALSALVMRAEEYTPEGKGIVIINSADQSQLNLQLGSSLSAKGEPGLEPGYKAVSVGRVPVDPRSESMVVQLPPTAPVSMALSAANMARHNFVIMYGIGRIHGPELLDGGTVLLRSQLDDGANHDRPTRVAVMMKGDMEGIAPGYMLVTPPQVQPVIRSPGFN